MASTPFPDHHQRQGARGCLNSPLWKRLTLKATSALKCAVLVLACLTLPAATVRGEDADTLVKAAFDYFRGRTSVSLVDMTVHRPDWERVFTIKAWTKGTDRSLFFTTAPPKDAGNGTLKRGREMWIYNPKVNRIIKIPPSMMSQAWMGSDFSNNDLAKSDSLLVDYTHRITGTETHDGKTVYLIESRPTPMAPVIWGLQRLKLREDHILLQQTFCDEALSPVKEMTAHDIRMLGGRLFPASWKMRKTDTPDEYTLLEYRELTFDEEIPDRLFTLASLKTPQETP